MFSVRIDDDTELRLLEERHAEEVFALIDQNREYLREWLPNLDTHNCLEDTKESLRRSLEQFSINNGLEAGIWFQGKLAGAVAYPGVDWVHRKTSVVVWLGASFQGRGLATKACRALVDYAFTELQLSRVEMLCARENKTSRAIPERLGFVREGTIRQMEWPDEPYAEHVVYAMDASTWQSPTKRPR